MSPAGRAIAWSRPWSGAPQVLAVHGADVEWLGRLRGVGMFRALVDPQVTELYAPERTARQHALDRLLEDPLREAPFHDGLGAALLDAADEAGVVVIHLLLQLLAGQD